MHERGLLDGQKGTQSRRPRLYIRVDDQGCPVDPSGRPVGTASVHSRLDYVEDRIARLEDRLAKIAETERVRLVEPMLKSAIEHQHRATQLQVAATEQQEAASKQQASVVSALTAEDPQPGSTEDAQQ